MSGAAVVDVVLAMAAAPVAIAAGYLLVLTLASRRPPAPRLAPPRLRFDLVVPAHDEEAGIAATVASLLAVEYPEALRRVWIVADNCSDATAERAGAAGAHVLVREDRERRGKGYALEHAFATLLREGRADAMVVVDADTVVSPNLLAAFSARLEAGALAVQADYRVRNPEASWRTRLMAVAFALVNTLRCLGRERLRCSVGLRGNGMCFAARVLREVPHQAFSIVEDLEYGIRLGLAGHRVHFAAEAVVRGDMVSGEAASRSQRRRWERGRREIARRDGAALVRSGLSRRDPVLVDLGLDLLVPPLALLGTAAAAGAALSVAAGLLSGRFPASGWAWGASLASLCAYVARGWWLSGTGLRGLGGLLFAPVYLFWKIGLALTRPEQPDGTWVRTERERASTARGTRA